MQNEGIDQQKMLRSILDGMEALICVCDSETFDILFLNDSIRNNFNIEGDGIGHKCYKLLQKRDDPCPTCPYMQLHNEPEKTLVWEHTESVKGSILRKTARLIDWPNGRKAHLEYAIDITELRKTQETVVQLGTEVAKIYYDSLTGIYNRRYFDENIEHLISSLSRSNGSLSLLMADIDFFKMYNDTYGHQKGDECLKLVAEIIQKSITRSDDYVARYGGEEFVIVLPNTDEIGARMIAERIIHEVWNTNILHEGNIKQKRVTISIGVTTGEVKHNMFGAKDFIHRADDMLYESKRKGRNKYTFACL
jgi:diguanylate cyclase (GGDEF)-like protein